MPFSKPMRALAIGALLLTPANALAIGPGSVRHEPVPTPSARVHAKSGNAGSTTVWRTLDGRPLSEAAIDREVSAILASEHIAGLGVGLVRNGRVAFVRSWGYRNVEKRTPLSPDTVMYAGSLTKAAFSYFVLQLCDEGRIDLDAPISKYLPRPLAEYKGYAVVGADPRWTRLTMRMLLNHTTGFANLYWMEPDKTVRFHRDPGTRYGYSGEGMRLAQLVLQEGLGIDVGAEMQRRLFTPLGMTRSGMTWRAAFDADNADGYTEDGSFKEHRIRARADAAGSLDTSLRDWTRFMAAAARGFGLSAKARAEMTRASVRIDSVVQFPTLTEERTTRWQPLGLGYGVGWGVVDTRYGHGFFKEGHDDGTDNYAFCLDKRRDCIVLLSNDNRSMRVFATLIDRLFGPVDLAWDWEGYAPPRRR